MCCTIARRTGLRIEDIRRWNPIEGDLIRVGQTLSLQYAFRRKPSARHTRCLFRGQSMEVAHCCRGILLVHCTGPPGDLADLLDLNAAAPEDLRPGMCIRIPLREHPDPTPQDARWRP